MHMEMTSSLCVYNVYIYMAQFFCCFCLCLVVRPSVSVSGEAGSGPMREHILCGVTCHIHIK